MEKHQNITLSFPRELSALLHDRIPRRGISQYVAKAVRKALEEDERKSMSKLEAAYEQAEKDRSRSRTIKELKTLDADEIEGWEWDE